MIFTNSSDKKFSNQNVLTPKHEANSDWSATTQCRSSKETCRKTLMKFVEILIYS